LVSWSKGLNTGRLLVAGAGTQTAGLALVAIYLQVVIVNTATEEYNGTTWTAGGSLSCKICSRSSGIQTAALAFGGDVSGPPFTVTTEEYDGTSWTASNNLNTGRRDLAGAGIQTAALAFGGNVPPETGATEEYDGTSWTTSPASLSTARQGLGGAGTQPAALGFGGYVPGVTTATEEYTITGTAGIKTITVS
jgi:hypothetical protein